MKVVFMGSSNFSVPFLQKLIDGEYDIVGVFTKKPSTKRRKIIKNPIHMISEENGLAVYTETANMLDILYSLKPNKIIVASYGNILSNEIVENFDCINAHASLLPKYRGSSPIQTSLLNGDLSTGVTIIKMDKGMDTGEIIAKEVVDIDKNDDYLSLENKLSFIGSELLHKSIRYDITTPQEYILPPTKILTKLDGLIDWNTSSVEIFNKIKALKYNPKVFFEHNSVRYNIYKIQIRNDIKSNCRPGEIIDNRMTIKTKDGHVSILEIQKEGKNISKIIDFLNGNREFTKGTLLQ